MAKTPTKAEPMGQRRRVKDRTPKGDFIPGERKKSATGAPHHNPLTPKKRDNTPRLISYEKNTDGTGTIRVGRGTVDLLQGIEDVREWSDEELLQGHRNNTRRPPNVVPMGVYLELVNRLMSRARFYFAAELEVAMTKHFQIIQNIDPTDPDRKVTMVEWMAIKEVYERVMGQAEQKVTIGLEPESWKKAIADALVPSDTSPQSPKGDGGDEDDPIDEAV